MPLSPFTQPWADSLREILNADPAYQDSSKNWRWPLALVLEATPSLGYPEPVAVELDLVNGHCDAATAKPAAEVSSAYVLQGSYENWKALVREDLDPVTAVIGGRLKLAKGSLFSLMSHVASARALVACARRVDTHFPDEP